MKQWKCVSCDELIADEHKEIVRHQLKTGHYKFIYGDFKTPVGIQQVLAGGNE